MVALTHFSSISLSLTLVLRVRTIPCNNIASVLAAPDDPWLGMATSAANELSGASFGDHHITGGLFVDNIWRNDHLQRGSLQDKERGRESSFNILNMTIVFIYSI